MRFLRVLLPLVLFASPWLAAGQTPPPFEIRDGDRVLLIGDVLLEREGTYGALETRLDTAFPQRHFTVRNLSWSGDTPVGIARASFDPPDKGWDRLQEQLDLVKPTVAILGYGMASSLQEVADRSHDILLNPDPVRYGREPMTAERFGKELEQLMDAIQKSAGGEVRFLLLSPIKHQDVRATKPGSPDPAEHNKLLAAYSAKISEIAAKRSARFVSLDGLGDGANITENGIHLTQEGYPLFANFVSRQLGWSIPENLPPGNLNRLNEAIRRKSQLFFYRWRPENYTYLFGFRKHEQGQNAKEIPEFDPLIAQAEKEIDEAKGKLSEPAPAPDPTPTRTELKPVAQELPKFDIEDGYKIELWATNPLLEKPIQMNWDADGRLWVASSSTYPQVNPEDVAASLAAGVAGKKDAPAAANDRIIILEDSNHTGHADKSTVFAEGLLIPTAVAPYRNAQGQWGCYVGQSTEVLELTDTTGSGHADRKRIVFSGFGTEDTHHLVHTMKWGPDARLNFDQSIYIHTHMETPWGMVRLNSGGVYAWDPRSEKVEVQCKGFCNPWGHVWDDKGESFITDGAGAQGITWAIPGAMFFTYENGRKICPSISPGTYPKFASLERIQSPNFPADWQGSLITCDFRAHRIVHFGLNDLSQSKDPATRSAGYITQELPDLVRTSDLFFRPIDVRLGPDGALYVADWSNPVINHGEVDFRDPRRDHHQGRIWRITKEGGPVVPWEKLSEKNTTELAKLLTSNSAWQEQQATLQIQYAKGEKPVACCPNPPPVGKDEEKNENPRVRLNAMRGLAREQTAEAAGRVLAAALNAPPGDAYYEYAAWLSITDLAEPWTQAVLADHWRVDSPERERQLEFALDALDPLYGAPVLAHVLAGRTLPADGSGPWIELIGKAGGPAELAQLFTALVGQMLNTDASVRALDALREAARLRGMKPSGDLAPLEPLLSHENLRISTNAARLVGIWKTPHALPTLRELAGGGTRTVPLELRVAAVDGLHEFGGTEVVGVLKALLENRPAPGVPRAAAVALAGLDLRGSLPGILSVLKELPDDTARLETWRAMLSNKGAPDQIANAIARRNDIQLDLPVAQTGLRVARELGKPGQNLANALAPLAGAKVEAAQSPQQYADLAALVKRDGDPARGEEVFRRPQLACLTCHAIGGAGGKVGPELTSLGASAPLDYIIESVLAPAAKVKEGFFAVSLTLKDGTAQIGIPARETNEEIFLRTATGQELPVVKANIVSKETIGSIMPPGLTDQLKDRERIDLYAFLAQLGRSGPYDASKGTVARYWGLFPAGTSASSLPWPGTPAYTLVDGRLTKEQLQTALSMMPAPGGKIVAATRFQLPAGGPTNLHLAGLTEAVLDGQPVMFNAGGATRAELPAGKHTLTVTIDPQALPEALRVDSPEAKFLGN